MGHGPCLHILRVAVLFLLSILNNIGSWWERLPKSLNLQNSCEGKKAHATQAGAAGDLESKRGST